MSTRGLLALAAVVVGGAAGCSAPSLPPVASPGTVSPGSAQVALNAGQTVQSHSVQCVETSPITTIVTGDQRAGTTVVVSNTPSLTANSVQIRNVDGFTGSSYADVVGDAHVQMAGSTYAITGTADGVAAVNPSFSARRTYSILVAC